MVGCRELITEAILMMSLTPAYFPVILGNFLNFYSCGLS